MHRRYAVAIAAFVACLAWPVQHARAHAACAHGSVFEDANGNGVHDAGERGLAGVKVSDGEHVVATDARGRFTLASAAGRSVFVIKPAGFDAATRADGLPATWWRPGADRGCPAFALRRAAPRTAALDVLVFADPQPADMAEVGYYARDVVEPLLATRPPGTPVADLGLTLGDIVNDDATLYPAVIAQTSRLGTPWLNVPGNHDLDRDAATDETSLGQFHRHFGPDTYAWEEPEATFVVLDDVIARPGQRPAYIGGLRADQFAFLERYLSTVPRDRLLVLAVHMPLFSADGRVTFRPDDRARLFALLRPFPKLLVLSAHNHTQRHWHHDVGTGWHGGTPLHEYNVGAISGAFWSGVADAAGVPDATMADGTPNGHARLRVDAGGGYRLSWHPARLASTDPGFTGAMALHAPRVLRRGAYPAWGVFANVFMGDAGTRVEYRVDEGEWMPMTRVELPDPRLVAENVRDDQATALRARDRSPEAVLSPHLWRGALPTTLAAGEHRVEVRVLDRWLGEQRAHTIYRLVEHRR